jgi:protein involved in polysaccharide export with SLBB domain
MMLTMATHYVTLILLAASIGLPPAQGAQPTDPQPPMTSAEATVYVVGPEDTLAITVADEPELTGRFRVDSDGTFSYPFVGRVEANGKSLTQLQTQLTRMLAAGYLRDPQVRVEMDQYRSRSVFVTGEVRNPNEFPMTSATMTLLQALALAGSPTPNASQEVIVSRQATDPGGEPENIRVNRRELELGGKGYDLLLHDGDIINVPAAKKFFVDGDGLDAVRYDAFPDDADFQSVDLDGDRWPTPGSLADVVTAVETIEHLENPWSFMRRLAALVKPGGLVVVTTPNQLSLLSLLTLVSKRRFSAFQDAHYPAHRTAPSSIRSRAWAW